MAEENIQATTPEKKKRKGKKIAIIAVIIVVALIVVGSLGSNNSNTSTNNNSAQQNVGTADGNNNTVETQSTAPQMQSITDGNVITTATKEVTIKKSEFSYDVEPDNPDSFYSHYAAEAGKVYIVLSVDVKNNGKAAIECDELLGVKADYNNGYSYSGFAVVDEGSDLGYANITALDPLSTQAMKYLIECPEEVETSTAPLFLIITVDGTQYQYTIR